MIYLPKINKTDLVLVLLGAGLLILSFPKHDIGGLAYPALAVLCYLGLRSSAPEEKRFLPGFLFGVFFYLGNIFWVSYSMEHYGGLPKIVSWSILFILCCYLALYFGFFTWGLNRLSAKSRLVWVAPFYWVALEYVRTYLLSGFPWSLIGYSQYKYIPLIQIADITGVYGLSFIVMSVAVSLAKIASLYPEIKSSHLLRYGLVPVFLLIAGLSYGYYRINHLKFPEKIRVGVIQGNVDQGVKWNPSFQQKTIDRYARLSRKAAGKTTRLIVWPETAAPFYFQSNEKFARQVTKLAKEIKTPLLFGAPAFVMKKGDYQQQNSAFLLSSEGVLIGKSDKIHLVPFGEYVPLSWLFKPFGSLVAEVGDFSPGDRPHPLQLGNKRLGVVICFEVIFPDLVRRFFKNGAHFLVNITNDAWFGHTDASYQHYSMVTFRAVENHAGVARSANTGISGFIDPLGRNISSTDIFVTTEQAADLPVSREKTVYTRYGDIFAWFCCIITLARIIRES
ncbi:MAG: apolipoprotein N-acyltransferase [bacterium]